MLCVWQVVQYGTNGLTFFVAGQLMDSGEDSFKDIMQAIMTLMLGYAQPPNQSPTPG